jgi:hypothetical protein
MRLSLLIREFRRLAGKTIVARVGEVIPASELAHIRDRKELTEILYHADFSMRGDVKLAGSYARPRIAA